MVILQRRYYICLLYTSSPAPENHEGIRLNFDKEHGDGWALVRLSLHEPILPVNVESNSKGGAKKIARELYTFLKQYDFLDLSALKRCV